MIYTVPTDEGVAVMFDGRQLAMLTFEQGVRLLTEGGRVDMATSLLMHGRRLPSTPKRDKALERLRRMLG